MSFDLKGHIRAVHIDPGAVRIQLVNVPQGDKDIHNDHPNRDAMVSAALLAAANGLVVRLLGREGSRQWIERLDLYTGLKHTSAKPVGEVAVKRSRRVGKVKKS
jgi:hypothetical protein